MRHGRRRLDLRQGQGLGNHPVLAEAYKIAALDAWNRMTRG